MVATTWYTKVRLRELTVGDPSSPGAAIPGESSPSEIQQEARLTVRIREEYTK